MKLEIIRNNEIVNTFDDAVTSLINNIWAHDQKLGTVKKMTVFPASGGYVNITFILNSGVSEITYKYYDVPYSGGLLDTYRLLNTTEKPGRWLAYRTDANGKGWYKYLLIDIVNHYSCYCSCGSLWGTKAEEAIKVSYKQLKDLTAFYEKAGYTMKGDL